MIEIWTEDSTAGYRFLKQINKTIYKSQLTVAPHNGIGESIPAGIAKYGGILYHLKRHQGNHLVLLYIDKAIDMQETAENYQSIIKEARKHVNIKIVEQICFELGMLSYNDLFDLCGNMKTEFMQVVQEFILLSKNLADFRPVNFSLKLRDYVMSKCGSKMQYEHVAKLMLAEATNVDIFYEGKHHYLSSI